MRLAARLAGVLLLLLTAGFATGCGAEDDGTTGAAGADARAFVPEDMRRAGVLVVGSDLVFEPMEFLRDGKPAGFDYDLAGLIAERLGLRLEFRQTSWGELLDQVRSKEIDLAMASITDKATRQEKVTFIDYLHVGSSIVTGTSVRAVAGLADLCGLRVAVQVDTMYADLARDLAGTCPAAKPLTTVVVSDTPRTAVKSGRADAYLNDYPVAVADLAAGGLRISGDQLEAAPYGIAVAKDRTDLVRAVQTALYQTFDDGSYDGLIEKWKLTEGSLKTGAINGGA
jgi:polar amino acid transport system substrate-binding protein